MMTVAEAELVDLYLDAISAAGQVDHLREATETIARTGARKGGAP
jgi:hypothetical protein